MSSGVCMKWIGQSGCRNGSLLTTSGLSVEGADGLKAVNERLERFFFRRTVEGSIQDSNRVDAYIPPDTPPLPPQDGHRGKRSPRSRPHLQSAYPFLCRPSRSRDGSISRKVDGMIQPRGCGNILPNNDRSEMCFQRQRVRTWYIPPCPACCLLQMRQAATGSGDSMSAGTGGTRHSTNGAGGRGRPGAVVRIPIKCPGSLDTAKLRVGTRDLPPWAAGPSRFLLKRVAEC